MEFATGEANMVAEHGFTERVFTIVQTAIVENNQVTMLQTQDAIKANAELIRTELASVIEANNQAVLKSIHKVLSEAENARVRNLQESEKRQKEIQE